MCFRRAVNPERVVVGGDLAEGGELLLGPLREALALEHGADRVRAAG